MTKLLENINSKKDAFLISNFARSSSDAAGSQRDYHGSHSQQPLETVEADIKTILNQPLSERAQAFYNDELSGKNSAILDSTKPWTKDANYFQNVHISSLALLKMTIHARSGGSIEVMGMLTGKIVKNGIVVMDVYPLPVEGTETRVNAQAEGYEFMVSYLESLKKTGRYENIVGWYHSHPGYGCWLSGIDVSTQSLNQKFQDPYLAIVVDPERTISNGKVEIGAFRTYSEEYTKNNALNSISSGNGSLGSLGLSPVVKKGSISKGVSATAKKVDNIPQDKVKDFGLHSSKYYSLSIEIFRSNMDHLILQNLWSKFWITNLLGDGNTEEGDESKKEILIQQKMTRYLERLELLTKSKDQEQALQRPRKPKFTNITQQPLLQRMTMSPFTKANIMSKLRGKNISDSEESDSEMKDDDESEADFVIDDEERAIQMSLESEMDPVRGFDGIRPYRKSRIPESDTGTGSVTSPVLENIKEFTGGDNVTKTTVKEYLAKTNMDNVSAEAGRELLGLKIQQILFLNED